MGRIADKRLLTPVSRINAVDHAGRIQTADKIDQDGTDHQHPQQQPADPLLDISAVLVARHHQHDEITLVVRIVDSRSQFFPFLETDYIAGIQGSDLLVGQIAGQGSTRLRDAVGIQQYFRCDRQRLLIMLLDTGVILFVQLILFPVLLCRRVCFSVR